MTHAMGCTECLRLVATADLSELTTGTAVTEHCRACADCASLVDAVAEEAQRLADTLDGTPPGVATHVVALRAVAGAARERRRGRGIRTGAAIAATLVSLFGFVLFRRAGVPSDVETRTVELQCLAPDQAAELARGSLLRQVSVSFRPSVHLPILTLRGSHRDLEAAQEVIAQLDRRWGAERSAYCASLPNVPPPADLPPSMAAPAPDPGPARAGPR